MSFLKKEKSKEPEIACIFASGDMTKIVIAKSILMDAGINYLTQNEYYQNIISFGNLGSYENPLAKPVEIFVAADEMETAAELLKNLK